MHYRDWNPGTLCLSYDEKKQYVLWIHFAHLMVIFEKSVPSMLQHTVLERTSYLDRFEFDTTWDFATDWSGTERDGGSATCRHCWRWFWGTDSSKKARQ